MRIHLKKFVWGEVTLIFALAWFALSPQARAVCEEGCDVGHLNTFLGDDALSSNTTGFENTATGANALASNTTGFNNTATGGSALSSNTTGSDNTAAGVSALALNTIGANNTASGTFALNGNTAGNDNTATGKFALEFNSTGNNNTATGSSALQANTTGFDNTANGFEALEANTTGGSNTATGVGALTSNTTGSFSTATGVSALTSNTTGGSNTADGNFALSSNTVGNSNVAVGFDALFSNTSGSSNIAMGLGAGANLTTGSNNIDIGNRGLAGESNRIRIGTVGTQTAAFIAGISGATVPGGVGVIVGNNGKLGTVVSSARFKDDIKPMNKASEAIHSLKPVTFRYKQEIDPEGIQQFGLVAEEVQKVDPNLVIRDADGKPFTVRYDAVNAMLLNEFLKEHKKVEEQQTSITQLNSKLASQVGIIARQQKGIEVLAAQLKEQAAQIQKVSAQVELNRSAARTVANNP